MNKSRFDLRALVSLTCTVDSEEKQLSVLLDNIVRQADDSIGIFYDDLCEQVSWKLPTAHAKAFLEEAEKQGDGLCEDWMFLVPDRIEQYTGLKDKNGHPICEGDIVKRHSKYSENEKDVVLQVEWNCKGARYITTDKKHDNWIFSMFDYEYEILGNIHENPELLEDKK